ncbi:hypothetical protein RUND412_004251 [Rhizina undulata]
MSHLSVPGLTATSPGLLFHLNPFQAPPSGFPLSSLRFTAPTERSNSPVYTASASASNLHTQNPKKPRTTKKPPTQATAALSPQFRKLAEIESGPVKLQGRADTDGGEGGEGVVSLEGLVVENEGLIFEVDRYSFEEVPEELLERLERQVEVVSGVLGRRGEGKRG